MSVKVLPSFSSVMLVFLLVSTIPQPAQAWDHKTHPGQMCIPWGSNTAVTYNGGQIGNNSNNFWMNVDCPINNEYSGNSKLDARVHVLDQSYSGDVWCQLVEQERAAPGMGGTRFMSGRSSRGSGAYEQTILLHGDVGSSYRVYPEYNSKLILRCAIPPKYSGNLSYVGGYVTAQDWR